MTANQDLYEDDTHARWWYTVLNSKIRRRTTAPSRNIFSAIAGKKAQTGYYCGRSITNLLVPLPTSYTTIEYPWAILD
jgi:hypothetical protein